MDDGRANGPWYVDVEESRRQRRVLGTAKMAGSLLVGVGLLSTAAATWDMLGALLIGACGLALGAIIYALRDRDEWEVVRPRLSDLACGEAVRSLATQVAFLLGWFGLGVLFNRGGVTGSAMLFGAVGMVYGFPLLLGRVPF